MKVNDQEFHIGLKAFIEHQNKLLILHSDPKGPYASSFWGMPGGKINTQETSASFETTLKREIQEELGEDFKVTIGEVFYAWKFILPGKLPILLLGISCKYLSGEISLSPEFDSYAWIEADQHPTYSMLPGQAAAIEKWQKNLNYSCQRLSAATYRRLLNL